MEITDQPVQAIIFDPNRYTKKVLALILVKAEQWGVSPLEAEVRLLDILAQRQREEAA